jgi:hypothetical protein
MKVRFRSTDGLRKYGAVEVARVKTRDRAAASDGERIRFRRSCRCGPGAPGAWTRCCQCFTCAATILTDNMIGAGVHINAIGGDCPGKTELHCDILLRSDIFVEFSKQTRIEGEIQQVDANHPVTELWRVISGKAVGMRDARQITLFDSVGFAIEDFSALRYVRDQLARTGQFTNLDMLADPDDPRDLYGISSGGSCPRRLSALP